MLDGAFLRSMAAPSSRLQRLERIEWAATLPVVEEPEIGARHAVTVAEHDVARDRLDAGAGEHAEIRGLRAPLRDDDLHRAGVEHGGTAHAHAQPRRHRARDGELA